MGKKVFIKGKTLYARPFHRDTGENLDDDSEIKQKLQKTDGVYNTEIVLPFDNRDDAEEYLNGKGIPTDGMMGNLLKRRTDADGNKIVVYKITRPHLEPNFEDPVLGPPEVIDSEGDPWNEEVLIGNGSEVTVKLDVWIGTKAKKIRWEGMRVDELVSYELQDEDAF